MDWPGARAHNFFEDGMIEFTHTQNSIRRIRDGFWVGRTFFPRKVCLILRTIKNRLDEYVMDFGPPARTHARTHKKDKILKARGSRKTLICEGMTKFCDHCCTSRLAGNSLVAPPSNTPNLISRVCDAELASPRMPKILTAHSSNSFFDQSIQMLKK